MALFIKSFLAESKQAVNPVKFKEAVNYLKTIINKIDNDNFINRACLTNSQMKENILDRLSVSSLLTGSTIVALNSDSGYSLIQNNDNLTNQIKGTSGNNYLMPNYDDDKFEFIINGTTSVFINNSGWN